MSELARRLAFEEALKADPYDKETHVIYADWLEEYGTQPGDDDLAREHRLWTPEWQKSKEWLTEFAKNCTQPEYDWTTDTETDGVLVTLEELVEGVQKFLETGKRIQFRGDGFGAVNQFWDTQKEFWEHWETYTRTVLGTHSQDPFSCCSHGA